jgi:hypothetical protein
MALMLVASNAVPPAYAVVTEKPRKRAGAIRVNGANGQKGIVPRAEESIDLSPVFLVAHSPGMGNLK